MLGEQHLVGGQIMLVNKNTSKKLSDELSIRFSNLIIELMGRQADERDQHDCGKGGWTQGTLDKSLAVDSYKLRLAVADFKTILAEIGRIK